MKRAFVNSLAAASGQNVPHWLLAYLGDAVPVELQITDFQIQKATSGWKVDLSGVYHGSYQTEQQASMEEVMSGFESELEKGPFHFKLESLHPEGNASAPENRADIKGHWMTGLSRAKQIVRSSGSANHFQWKGMIQ